MCPYRNSDPLLHLNEKTQILEKAREFGTTSFTTETGKMRPKTGQVFGYS